MTQLPEKITLEQIDAVYVSHGHPDHYADLHPLLRARVLEGLDELSVYAIPGAIDPVFGMDGRGELNGAYELVEFSPGDRFDIGPFDAQTYLLPHFVPNAGLRLEAGGKVTAYTGDTGPDPAISTLARQADVFIAEATFPRTVPDRLRGFLCSAKDAGEAAADAGVGQLVLTHLWPGTDERDVVASAREIFAGELAVALPGLTVDE
jgi:ribonuclease BN (tRNA processing enzyme)